MKAFVTGATGNIGRLLVGELLSQGWSVDAFVLPEEAEFFSEKEGVAVYQGNICDRNSIYQAMIKSMPDVVFHLAAYVQLGIINDMNTKEEIYNTNVNCTFNVLKSALEHGVSRAVYLSSVAAFGNSDRDGPINELSYMSGELSGEYEKTKYLGYKEAMNIQEQGLKLLIFMPGIIFGPGFPGTARYIDFFYQERTRRLPKDLIDTKIPLIYNMDLIRAIFTGIERNKFGEQYILVASSPTPREVLGLLSEVTGKEMKLKSISYRRALLGILLKAIVNRLTLRKIEVKGRVSRNLVKDLIRFRYRLEFDTSKARNELDWEPSPLKRTFQETVEWYKSSNESLPKRI
jgi:dihydroflavonol-4-reductase